MGKVEKQTSSQVEQKVADLEKKYNAFLKNITVLQNQMVGPPDYFFSSLILKLASRGVNNVADPFTISPGPRDFKTRPSSGDN